MTTHHEFNGSVQDDQRGERLPEDGLSPNDDAISCDNTFQLRRPLVLVGLMGAGKSSIGRALSKRLGVAFADADREIEAAAAMSVADIFETYGEAEFRALERRVLDRLLSTEPPGIIASGGGAFIEDETRAIIADRATSLWLRAGLDVLEGRTVGRTHRPLLNNTNVRETLTALIDKRYPIYALADIVIDTVDEHRDRTVARVHRAVHEHLMSQEQGT